MGQQVPQYTSDWILGYRENGVVVLYHIPYCEQLSGLGVEQLTQQMVQKLNDLAGQNIQPVVSSGEWAVRDGLQGWILEQPLALSGLDCLGGSGYFLIPLLIHQHDGTIHYHSMPWGLGVVNPIVNFAPGVLDSAPLGIDPKR